MLISNLNIQFLLDFILIESCNFSSGRIPWRVRFLLDISILTYLLMPGTISPKTVPFALRI